jgi:uncharacterized BrkB/YihY/UPF0761 family membrane protein
MNVPNRSGFDLHNLDPRIFVVVLPVFASVVLTWTGDRSTFVRAPRNLFENMCAILPATGYRFFRDRNMADIFSLLIILALLVLLLIPILGFVHRSYKIEQLTKMHKDQKMESRILQNLHEKDQ